MYTDAYYLDLVFLSGSKVGTFGTESPFHGQPSGAMFPFMVRQSPRKDIRVWMQSGEGDLALPPGNWPM